MTDNRGIQQQPDPDCCWSDSLLPGVIVDDFPAAGVEVEPMLMNALSKNVRKMVEVTHRSLISFAIVKNACSTFKAVFADVSRKGIFS